MLKSSIDLRHGEFTEFRDFPEIRLLHQSCLTESLGEGFRSLCFSEHDCPEESGAEKCGSADDEIDPIRQCLCNLTLEIELQVGGHRHMLWTDLTSQLQFAIRWLSRSSIGLQHCVRGGLSVKRALCLSSSPAHGALIVCDIALAASRIKHGAYHLGRAVGEHDFNRNF